jgi:hypothetical protein
MDSGKGAAGNELKEQRVESGKKEQKERRYRRAEEPGG